MTVKVVESAQNSVSKARKVTYSQTTEVAHAIDKSLVADDVFDGSFVNLRSVHDDTFHDRISKCKNIVHVKIAFFDWGSRLWCALVSPFFGCKSTAFYECDKRNVISPKKSDEMCCAGDYLMIDRLKWCQFVISSLRFGAEWD